MITLVATNPPRRDGRRVIESASLIVRQLDERLSYLNNPADAQAAVLVLLDCAAASSREWRAEAAAELAGLLIANFDGECV